MKIIHGVTMLSSILACIMSLPAFAEDLSSTHDSFPATTEVLIMSQAEEPGLIEEEEEYLEYLEEEDLDYLEEEEERPIADPFEGSNRFFFNVNDKLYFWVLKPVAKGYATVVHENIRIGIRNVFNNIATPIRFVNNLLQGQLKHAGNELIRFGMNTTFGILGLFDVAKTHLDMPMQDADLGQTLGVWGLGPAFFINWPLFGPSSVRDTIGFAGDYFLNPINYVDPTLDRIAIKAGDRVNRTSLVLGEYEDIKEAALDPYIAIRDIYHQYRQNKIEKRGP
jgi:phospholipid-binding lipoprotein MlaA